MSRGGSAWLRLRMRRGENSRSIGIIAVIDSISMDEPNAVFVDSKNP